MEPIPVKTSTREIKIIYHLITSLIKATFKDINLTLKSRSLFRYTNKSQAEIPKDDTLMMTYFYVRA